MSCPNVIVLIALLAIPNTVQADGPPKHSPAVKRIIDHAKSEVALNRQECDKANEKPLGAARRELGELATKLIDDGKDEEARAVLKQATTLEADVLRLAQAPQTDPLLLAKAGSFLGSWKYKSFSLIVDEQGWARVVSGFREYRVHLRLFSPELASCGEWVFVKVAVEGMQETVVALNVQQNEKTMLLSRTAPAPLVGARSEAIESSAVDRILSVAAKEVRKNLQLFDEANEQPLNTARKELKAAAKKLIADGKNDEAGVALRLAETIEKDVLGIANALQLKPAGNFKGKWESYKVTARVLSVGMTRIGPALTVDDDGTAVIEQKENKIFRAKLRLSSADSAECGDWILVRLAVEDMQDKVLMLTRDNQAFVDVWTLSRATALEEPEWTPLGLYHYTQSDGQKIDITIAKNEVAYCEGNQGSWKQCGGPELQIDCGLGWVIMAKKGKEPGLLETITVPREFGRTGTLRYSKKQP